MKDQVDFLTKTINMKQLSYFMIIMMLFSASKIEAQKITVNPSPLEVKGDSIYFTVNLEMPANKKYGKTGTVQINPRLGDYKYDFFPVTPINVTGGNKNMTTANIKVALPFIEDMIGNELDVDVIYKTADGNTIKTEIDDIAPCCVTLGMLFLNNSQFVMATTEQVTKAGNQPKKLVAQFNFPLDISTLDAKSFEKDIRSMGDFLKKYPNSKVTIRGFASPEGSYERNVELSEERSRRAAEWLQAQLKKYGYGKFVNPDNFKVDVTHEDWVGFIQVLEESNKFSGKTEAVRKIVSSGLSPMETERAVLKELGYSYEQRHAPELEALWKPLRRSVAVVETSEKISPPLTQAQEDSIVQAYIKGNIPTWQLREILNQEQWLEVAQETYAETGELSLLIGYYNVYRDDYRIINDLAILDLVEQTDVLSGNGLAIIGGDDALVGIVGGQYDVKWKKDIKKDPFKFKTKIKQEDGPENKLKYVYKAANFEGPIPMLELAYEMERDDWAVLSNLGAAYMVVENWPKAQGYIEQSLKKKSSKEANYNLGLLYARRNQLDQAIKYFNMAGDMEGVYYNRGLAKYLKGDYAGAKNDLQKHIENHPGMAVGYYVLAAIGAKLKDEQLMATNLRQAIAIKKILSDISQEDLAFKDYWDTEVFEDASDDDPKK